MKLYMNQAEAVEAGFTNHGTMFSVDCWVTDDDIPMVAAKFAPAEIWISLCTALVQTFAVIGLATGFHITIGHPIERVEPQ